MENNIKLKLVDYENLLTFKNFVEKHGGVEKVENQLKLTKQYKEENIKFKNNTGIIHIFTARSDYGRSFITNITFNPALKDTEEFIRLGLPYIKDLEKTENKLYRIEKDLDILTKENEELKIKTKRIEFLEQKNYKKSNNSFFHRLVFLFNKNLYN